MLLSAHVHQCSLLWFLSKFAMFVLVFLKFAMLHFFLLQFPVWGGSITCCCIPPIQLSLLVTVGSKDTINICRTVKAAAFNSNAPLDADDSCAPCFLQHRLPFLIISTNFVPTNMILTSTVIQKPTFSKPHTYSSMSISLTFSTSCLCLSSNSLAASFYNKQVFQVKV